MVPPGPDGSMQAYMTSLKRLQKLSLGILFPGHGPPVAAAQDRIAQYLHHRQQREDAIYGALTDGWHSVGDVVQAVYQDTPADMWHLAQLTIRSHLEKLVVEQRVEEHDGMFRAAG